jgi:hypothetical protein
MFSLRIENVPVLFIQAFTADDAQSILWFVREAAANSSSKIVLFIDTPIAPYTVPAVNMLTDEGYRVVLRDHHGLDGEPTNDNEKRVSRDTARLKASLGEDCVITKRRLHPACSTLVTVGEFATAAAIIADPDADGLTAAAKAIGLFYPELDADAAILDGEPYLQVTGSPLSQLLAKGIATLPSFDRRKPKEREDAKKRLFARWLDAAKGNQNALKELERTAHLFDDATEVSKHLASQLQLVAPGVVLVDASDSPIYVPGALMHLMEEGSDCRVTVVRKALGPIAALHGIQYSLSVTKQYQDQVDLRKLIPSNWKADPANGVISNVPFLLHVSEEMWLNHVLPKLSRGV